MKQHVPHMPGPGAYGGDQEDSLFANVTKRVASRGGVFGSSGPRFKAKSRTGDQTALPGPGSYESMPQKSNVGCGHRSSTFASGTVRMKAARGAAEPKYSEFESDKEVLGV